jgi:hypothetical protein
MAYSQGGLIEAIDYNNLINGSNQLNTVWGVGNGDAGYGQTPITAVVATDTVTATQWATLINRLNSVRNHQSGVGSDISAVTAGQRIDHLSTLQTQVNTAFTNRGLRHTTGSTTTAITSSFNPTSGTGSINFIGDTRIFFSSANAARYFFNAGGQINFIVSATDNAGNARSQSLRDMINQCGGISAIRNTTNGGRTGIGGTLTVNNTGIGQRNIGSGQTIVQIADDAPYGSGLAQLQLFNENGDTSNGSVAATMVLRIQGFLPADDAFGGGVNLTVNPRVDIVFPSTAHLTNTWGTPTANFAWTFI